MLYFHICSFSFCMRNDKKSLVLTVFLALFQFSSFSQKCRIELLGFWGFGEPSCLYRWDFLKLFWVVGKLLTTTLGVIIGYGRRKGKITGIYNAFLSLFQFSSFSQKAHYGAFVFLGVWGTFIFCNRLFFEAFLDCRKNCNNNESHHWLWVWHNIPRIITSTGAL